MPNDSRPTLNPKASSACVTAFSCDRSCASAAVANGSATASVKAQAGTYRKVVHSLFVHTTELPHQRQLLRCNWAFAELIGSIGNQPLLFDQRRAGLQRVKPPQAESSFVTPLPREPSPIGACPESAGHLGARPGSDRS